MSPRRARVPRWYFSLRSPYSWLAWHELTRSYPDVAARLDWRPFWEPDETGGRALRAAGGTFVYTPMSKEKHLYILQDVRRLTARYGLSVTWPVDERPRWEVPHLAYLMACDAGRGADFIAASYRARWQDGRDICDPGVIAGVADALGLDPARAASAADDPDLRERGTQCLLDVSRDGVFGVPYFILGFDRYWGLDRLPAFAAAIRGAATAAPRTGQSAEADAEAARTLASAGLGTADWGHAGGCG